MSGKAAAVIQTIMPAITTAMSGIFAGRQNKLQRQHEANMYRQAQKDNLANWNMQNEYNSPAQMMARLKAAGMNPNLAYGEFSAGRAEQPNYTPQQVTDQSQNLSRAMDFSQMGNVMSNIYDLRVKKAQAENLEAQAGTQLSIQALNSITTELTRLRTIQQKTTNEFESRSLETRIKTLEAQQEQIIAQTENTRTNTRSQNQGIAESQQRMQLNTEKNVRDWEAHKMGLKEAITRIAVANSTIRKNKAEIGLIGAQTSSTYTNEKLVKEQILSAPIQRALLQSQELLQRMGISPSDGVLSSMGKKIMFTTEQVFAHGMKGLPEYWSAVDDYLTEVENTATKEVKNTGSKFWKTSKEKTLKDYEEFKKSLSQFRSFIKSKK